MFWDRYKTLCENSKNTPNGVAKLLEISNSSCTQWKNGVLPKGDTLLKIANFFNCSIDYLLGRTENLSVNETSNLNSNSAQNPQSNILLDIFNTLDPADQAKLLVYAGELKNQSAKNK